VFGLQGLVCSLVVRNAVDVHRENEVVVLELIGGLRCSGDVLSPAGDVDDDRSVVGRPRTDGVDGIVVGTGPLVGGNVVAAPLVHQVDRERGVLRELLVVFDPPVSSSLQMCRIVRSVVWIVVIRRDDGVPAVEWLLEPLPDRLQTGVRFITLRWLDLDSDGIDRRAFVHQIETESRCPATVVRRLEIDSVTDRPCCAGHRTIASNDRVRPPHAGTGRYETGAKKVPPFHYLY